MAFSIWMNLIYWPSFLVDKEFNPPGTLAVLKTDKTVFNLPRRAVPGG